MNDPPCLVMGGQGREARSIRETAGSLFILAAIGVVAAGVAALAAWFGLLPLSS